MSALWYCCECSCGPHQIGLDTACTQCGEPRCEDCSMDTQHPATSLHHCHETSPYPQAPAPRPSSPSMNLAANMASLRGCNTLQRPTLYHADVRQHYMPSVNSQQLQGTVGHSNLYFCCQCGDGPKLYQNQPKCVICNHAVCQSCKPAK
ncbi:uncharacterized protein BO80DRAFT_146037 [Aspergillus ibericus CBS 121593]|uniref:Uncharacterized protein n=1 Tax=Aspergillus ibericus CBS 121593 TaxID=1448316 RepID=A0A395GTR8_9EURO|nr:hypothetical protein BO80DRAFT_146037 [Aspergillus ibericus CBS 121593]RAK98836.1 hypothetical protein BO80DRAFT_146037 [Aspergillus ibericus CBS 121593]